MKFSYRISKICGSIYSNGNLQFTADGNSVLSPIGNRVALYDLLRQTSSVLPFENRKNIQIISLSHNGRFLVTVDVDGHALLINFPRRVILHRFNFRCKVYDLKFSPNDEFFAVTHGNGVQIWQTPSIVREFSPLRLCRVLAGSHDEVVCLDWSSDGDSVAMGSRDNTVRIYYRVHSRNMALSVLTGHRDRLRGVFFAEGGDEAYSVAQDGAVFTWKFDFAERDVVAADGVAPDAVVRTTRGGAWRLVSREFLWDPHTQVSSVTFNPRARLLLVGFDKGVFSLYEMPGGANLHKLSVSHQSINAVAINPTGEWLVLGSSRLGQLVVWEWKSESYVMKQQGHVYGLNCVDYSSDGHFMATGGEDSKVKLWNTTSGFCFVTFAEHLAPVTGVKFFGAGTGRGVLSCSLDGTVRAHDLLRYKNFRTLTTPTPVQFTSLAVDAAGEIVCAGAMDPFQIFVWSLQTGRLLDVLSGHEGPIACLDFTAGGAATTALASGSWDGTLKLWNVYENTCTETFEHGCDVLACAFRPDGREFVTATTNGCIYVWDVESGAQLSVIEGRRDISGGRLTTDRVTADNASRSKYFTSLAYTSDGQFVLAAGRSKFCCIYSLATGVLVKKFQLSHNRSLEGILDELRSDRLVDGVSLDNVNNSDDEDNADGGGAGKYAARPVPGGGSGSKTDGSRTNKAEILTTCVKFSSTGTEWAAATTQGLQVFSLDEAMQFAPTDIDITITPQSVLAAVSRQELGLAINMALHLGEADVLKVAVDAVPVESVDVIARALDVRMLKPFLTFLAEQLASSAHVEYYLQWCYPVLHHFSGTLLQQSLTHLEALRSLLRVVAQHEKDFMVHGDRNQFMLSYMQKQIALRTQNSGSAQGNDVQKSLN